MRTIACFTIVFAMAFAGILFPQSNIDPANKFGWGENVGWTNWLDADGTTAGVVGSGVPGNYVFHPLGIQNAWGELLDFETAGGGQINNGNSSHWANFEF